MKLPEICHHRHDHENGHSHKDEHGHHNHQSLGDFTDYMEAVAEYKKSFPTKEDIVENTPDPAVKEMLLQGLWRLTLIFF